MPQFYPYPFSLVVRVNGRDKSGQRTKCKFYKANKFNGISIYGKSKIND